jgi:hypothetical protein
MKKEDEVKRSRSSHHGENGEEHQPSDWYSRVGRYVLPRDSVPEDTENNFHEEEKNWKVVSEDGNYSIYPFTEKEAKRIAGEMTKESHVDGAYLTYLPQRITEEKNWQIGVQYVGSCNRIYWYDYREGTEEIEALRDANKRNREEFLKDSNPRGVWFVQERKK